MNLDELKQLLDVVRANEFTEFELEQEGFRIRIRKDGGPVAPIPTVVAKDLSVVAPNDAPVAASAAPPAVSDIELAIIKSPIVGTFYRSPQPGAPPFADIGQVVRKGQVMCIIEAMKLMNEIESEYDGEVVSIYVENGQPVQYGERLFAIKTR
ncbi:MAG: acetyl-CoA carboxylase biotin carboxyl carrier protein [Vicinamibacterales bacterium]